MGCWCGSLSGARCRLAYGPGDATATHCLISAKSRLVLHFWYRLTRVVPEKGPLNGCVCGAEHIYGVNRMSTTMTLAWQLACHEIYNAFLRLCTQCTPHWMEVSTLDRNRTVFSVSWCLETTWLANNVSHYHCKSQLSAVSHSCTTLLTCSKRRYHIDYADEFLICSEQLSQPVWQMSQYTAQTNVTYRATFNVDVNHLTFSHQSAGKIITVKITFTY